MGARVMLCDESSELGGSLLGDAAVRIEGSSGPEWVQGSLAELRSFPHVTLLTRTTGFGYFPHNLIGLSERLTDHLAAPPAHLPRERLWQVRARRVVLATGARWRIDGVGRANTAPIRGFDAAAGRGLVLTPDDDLSVVTTPDPVLIFDDDHYYLGSVLAEKLRGAGHDVTVVTPADRIAAWTVNTLEQHSIQKRLLEFGVHIVMNHNIVEFDGQRAVLACTYTERESSVSAGTILTVTSRLPHDELYDALAGRSAEASGAGIVSISAIGDCLAPSTIAAAVYAGHRYGREFDQPSVDDVGFRRELPH